MERTVRGDLLHVKRISPNIRVCSIRSTVEPAYAIFRDMFHFFHAIVTTTQIMMVKSYFKEMCYNLMNERSLSKIA